MKIALSEQITEAELHRDELEALITPDANGQPELHRRRHRAEGIVLSLHLIQTTERDFREFMRQRRTTNHEAD